MVGVHAIFVFLFCSWETSLANIAMHLFVWLLGRKRNRRESSSTRRIPSGESTSNSYPEIQRRMNFLLRLVSTKLSISNYQSSYQSTCQSIYLSINLSIYPIKQPIDQPIRQPISQSINQFINQSINQPTNLSINVSVNLSVNISINLSINISINQA